MNRGETLIAQLLAGPLTPEERDELRRCLGQDPALRRKLGEHASLHGLLGVVMEDDARREQVIASLLEACAEADRDDFESGVKRKIRRVRFRRIVGWAAAAVVALAAGLTLWTRTPQPVATISNMAALEANTRLQAGKRLFRGDSLRLQTGLVELDLAGRGHLIAEGPVDLEFTSATSATLTRGRVVLRVNESGHGYRLETPRGAVIDLGTEFGVSVDETTGEVETHVIEGEVKALSNEGGGQIHLKKDEALRQTGRISTRIPINQGSFYASLPPSHGGSVGMIHWSMEPENDGVVRGRTRNLGDDACDLKLRAGTRPVEGAFARAIHFDGDGGFAETEYRGIGGNRPRTLAFWVKVPRDFTLSQGFAMISWGEFSARDPGCVWQISVNPLPEDGPVGRLRVGVHGGKAIGTTDLRDDQWHHVAVVLYPAAAPSFGQHVLMFIDGSLEPISSRTLGVIDTDVEQATHGIWLGRDVASPASKKRLFFRGALDEVYIFDAALSKEEIHALMERNEW